jgi:hypothetical protein
LGRLEAQAIRVFAAPIAPARRSRREAVLPLADRQLGLSLPLREHAALQLRHPFPAIQEVEKQVKAAGQADQQRLNDAMKGLR